MDEKKEESLKKADLDVFLEKVKTHVAESSAKAMAENKANLAKASEKTEVALAKASAENKANLAQANAKTKEALAKALERTEIALAKASAENKANLAQANAKIKEALAKARAENKRDLYVHSLIITGFILAGLGIFQYFPPQKARQHIPSQPIQIYTYPPQQDVKGTDQVAQRKPEGIPSSQSKDSKTDQQKGTLNTDQEVQ